ncbi:membrane protein [Mycobacterium antarcticum]|nr:membrane protein [Mycolicibacterium sp. TUM20985]GLP81927.1 membrane protein [Mycolicibacterium sp. TUM20984]
MLFREPGATWWWLLAGPLSATTMMLIQLSSGYGWQPLLPGVFLILVTGFLGLQVKAARIHTSVELTPEYLRQGAETILVSEIERVYPEADGAEVPTWQSSRALGELTGVPRGRTGIGLKLSSGRRAQAWARRHRQLRIALGSVVEERAR